LGGTFEACGRADRRFLSAPPRCLTRPFLRFIPFALHVAASPLASGLQGVYKWPAGLLRPMRSLCDFQIAGATVNHEREGTSR
jgi:hypothetical protein